MTFLYEPEIKVDVAAEECAPLNDHDKNLVDPMGSGFIWYTPPLAATEEHSTGGQTWQISGHDMQVLTLSVPPNDIVVAEVGSFMFGSPFIKTDVELTLCTRKGFGEGCNRICGGESCVKVTLENESTQEGYIGLTPNFPGKIIPVKFGTHVNESHSLILQPGTYMAQLGDVDVSCDLDIGFATCCCAGFGLCRQKIRGSRDSIAFLAASGTLVYRKLEAGETVTVDSSSVVAIEESVSIGIAPNGRFCACLCGGEGCFSTTLTGPGKVFMQSMNLLKFRDAVTTTVIDDRGTATAAA